MLMITDVTATLRHISVDIDTISADRAIVDICPRHPCRSPKMPAARRLLPAAVCAAKKAAAAAAAIPTEERVAAASSAVVCVVGGGGVTPPAHAALKACLPLPLPAFFPSLFSVKFSA